MSSSPTIPYIPLYALGRMYIHMFLEIPFPKNAELHLQFLIDIWKKGWIKLSQLAQRCTSFLPKTFLTNIQKIKKRVFKHEESIFTFAKTIAIKAKATREEWIHCKDSFFKTPNCTCASPEVCPHICWFQESNFEEKGNPEIAESIEEAFEEFKYYNHEKMGYRDEQNLWELLLRLFYGAFVLSHGKEKLLKILSCLYSEMEKTTSWEKAIKTLFQSDEKEALADLFIFWSALAFDGGSPLRPIHHLFSELTTQTHSLFDQLSKEETSEIDVTNWPIFRFLSSIKHKLPSEVLESLPRMKNYLPNN